MTPRSTVKMRFAAVFWPRARASSRSAAATLEALAYFLQPFDPTIAAPGPSFDEKKIVILCNVTSSSLAEFPRSNAI